MRQRWLRQQVQSSSTHHLLLLAAARLAGSRRRRRRSCLPHLSIRHPRLRGSSQRGWGCGQPATNCTTSSSCSCSCSSSLRAVRVRVVARQQRASLVRWRRLSRVREVLLLGSSRTRQARVTLLLLLGQRAAGSVGPAVQQAGLGRARSERLQRPSSSRELSRRHALAGPMHSTPHRQLQALLLLMVLSRARAYAASAAARRVGQPQGFVPVQLVTPALPLGVLQGHQGGAGRVQRLQQRPPAAATGLRGRANRRARQLRLGVHRQQQEQGQQQL